MRGGSEHPASLGYVSERPAALSPASTSLNWHVTLHAERKRKVGFGRGILLEKTEKYVSGVSEDSVLTCLLIVPDVPQMSKGTRR